MPRTLRARAVRRGAPPLLSASLPALESGSSHYGSSLAGAWQSLRLVKVLEVGPTQTETRGLGPPAPAPAAAHGSLSTGKPTWPGVLGTKDRGGSRSRWGVVHGRRQLEPLSRGTWRQSPAGGGSTQKDASPVHGPAGPGHAALPGPGPCYSEAVSFPS